MNNYEYLVKIGRSSFYGTLHNGFENCKNFVEEISFELKNNLETHFL